MVGTICSSPTQNGYSTPSFHAPRRRNGWFSATCGRSAIRERCPVEYLSHRCFPMKPKKDETENRMTKKISLMKWIAAFSLALALTAAFPGFAHASGGTITPDDVFTGPQPGLYYVNLWYFGIESALEDCPPLPSYYVPIDVIDTDGDGRLDIWIPWTDYCSSSPATLIPSPFLCFPPSKLTKIAIELHHQYACEVTAFDASSSPVDSAVAAPTDERQELELIYEDDGIAYVEFRGAEIAIHSIRWECTQ